MIARPRLVTAATWWPLLGTALGLVACVGGSAAESDRGAAVEPQAPLKFGHFNIRELGTKKLTEPGNRQVEEAARIIADFRPDILSINELQFDLEDMPPNKNLPGAPATTPLGNTCEARNARRLADRIAEVDPTLRYDYTMVVFGNSGVPFVSPTAETQPTEFRLRGFGNFVGQFNVALLSRYPILHDRIQVIHDYPWQSLPDNQIEQVKLATGLRVPEGFPLFEKALVVVPVDVNGVVLHVILLHPVTSGRQFSPMNSFRNHDEIRALAMLLDGTLTIEGFSMPDDARFVIVGDLNADPEDGDGDRSTIPMLTSHRRVVPDLVYPEGEGSTTGTNPRNNTFLSGCGRDDGIVRPPSTLPDRQLHLDYILPSTTVGKPIASGIFWPTYPSEDFDRTCRASDHRFVWADLEMH